MLFGGKSGDFRHVFPQKAYNKLRCSAIDVHCPANNQKILQIVQVGPAYYQCVLIINTVLIPHG